MLKKKVVVIDDSLLFRNFITDIINASEHFEVIGTAANAMEGIQRIVSLKPDIITLDIQMPGMNGLDMLKQILPEYRVPVILVSSVDMSVFEALNSGAVDFLGKPDFTQTQSKEQFKVSILSKLKIASFAKVRISTINTTTKQDPIKASTQNVPNSMIGNISPLVCKNNIVAIGASTGGTEAIIQVIRDFPSTFPPIVITQHMAPGFTALYAERLNRICNLKVKEAKSGDIIEPGNVYLAPSGLHMKLMKLGGNISINCFLKERLHGVIPAVDYLFDSVAELYENRAIGVILTGMGSDGAISLLNMRNAGALTIGQNKDTCVVYGMPMEAKKLGAVTLELPLEQIGARVIQELKRRS